MKKLLFCAVALTAFSFSTMANNEVKENEEKKKQEATGVNVCDAAFQEVYNREKNKGASDDAAYDAGSAAYSDCIDFHEKHDITLRDASLN